ncbi:pyridoxal phosphate-dependent transferase [Trichoderma novae-zelandiae]
MLYQSIRGCFSRESLTTPCNKTAQHGAVRGLEVEQWMDTYETTPGVLNIAETQGAIAANFLVFCGLIGPGDHVICVYPTYRQLFSVPESLGAEVSLWRLRLENGFVPDVDELETLVKANTKVRNHNCKQAVCQFHSCRGSYLTLTSHTRDDCHVQPQHHEMSSTKIVDFARARGIMVLSDEVYRPLSHNGMENNVNMSPSVADLGYEKAMVEKYLSKAHSLAGIRMGWIASGDKPIVEQLAEARHYTAISISQLGDQWRSELCTPFSPAVRGPLPRRNISLAQRNAAMVTAFVEAHPSVCSWVAPSAGTTALYPVPRCGRPGQSVDDVAFCRDVLDQTKVLFVPGSHCFERGVDFAGYLCQSRIRGILRRAGGGAAEARCVAVRVCGQRSGASQ